MLLSENPKGSDVFLWHKHLMFMAEARNFYGISTFMAKRQ